MDLFPLQIFKGHYQHALLLNRYNLSLVGVKKSLGKAPLCSGFGGLTNKGKSTFHNYTIQHACFS